MFRFTTTMGTINVVIPWFGQLENQHQALGEWFSLVSVVHYFSNDSEDED